MLEISPAKIGRVIVRARALDMGAGRGPAELREYIAGLNVDEKASLVAVMWIGRDTYAPEDLEEALQTARAEASAPTEEYLTGVPMLADFLEDGLDRLGISVEDAEDGLL